MKGLVIVSLMCIGASTKLLADENYKGITLHCFDTRSYIITAPSSNDIRSSLNYKVEVALSVEPSFDVEYVLWGYYPKNLKDWDNSSRSFKREEPYMDLVSNTDDKIIIERLGYSGSAAYSYDERSNKELTWKITIEIDRKTGGFSYVSGQYDKEGQFVRLDGEDGIARLKGHCSVEQRTNNKLF